MWSWSPVQVVKPKLIFAHIWSYLLICAHMCSYLLIFSTNGDGYFFKPAYNLVKWVWKRLLRVKLLERINIVFRTWYWQGACSEVCWLGLPACLCGQVHHLLALKVFKKSFGGKGNFQGKHPIWAFSIKSKIYNWIFFFAGTQILTGAQWTRSKKLEVFEDDDDYNDDDYNDDGDDFGHAEKGHSDAEMVMLVWQVLLGLSSVMLVRERRWPRWRGIVRLIRSC